MMDELGVYMMAEVPAEKPSDRMRIYALERTVASLNRKLALLELKVIRVDEAFHIEYKNTRAGYLGYD